MGILQEFKDFAIKGNMVDMAVGIIIGGGFGKLVSSFVEDVIMPPIGLMIGGVNFSELSYVLQKKTADVAAVTINYGNFIQHLLDFLILAFAIFMVVKGINSLKRQEEEVAEPSKEEALLGEVRDLLKEGSKNLSLAEALRIVRSSK